VKHISFLSLLLIIISQATLAQYGDTVIIKKLNQDWLNAVVNEDSTSLSQIQADDFILINPSGQRRTKADNAHTHIPGQQITGIRIDSEDLRMLTDHVGIITIWTTNYITAGAEKMIFKICYMDIYQKRNGKWKAVAAHVSLLK
jgi:ketosteroid isomerase-like protein